MSRTIGVSLFLASFGLAFSAVASPPPPPPAFVDDIAKRLLPTQTIASFDRYADLLTDNLTVTLNGKTIAANKADWLAIERARLGKVDRSVYGYAEGRDNLLVFDRFDDLSDEHCRQPGNCVFGPRSHARAVQYQLGPDHLVHSIQIVESDGLLRTQ